jgi:hypothetical protein
MMMRALLLAAGFALMFPASASAYENFIPMGTGYSTEVGSLPAFDSEHGQVIQQTDIYESEIYRKQRSQLEFQHHLRQFQSDSTFTGIDTYIDY